MPTTTITVTSAAASGVVTTQTVTEALPDVPAVCPHCQRGQVGSADSAQGDAVARQPAVAVGPQDSATSTGMACKAAGADLVPFTFPRRALRDNDILIDVQFCGLCHSDLHQVKNDWKGGLYPMVPGHEVVGIVEAVGKEVAAVGRFKVGDRIGVGCMVDSCQTCMPCKEGHEEYCEKGFIGTYNGKIHDPNRSYVGSPSEYQPGVDGADAAQCTWGGYATKLVVRQEFAISIPDSLPLEQAGPILCAGVTMYSPIKHWGLKAGDKLGIMGLGGLGHMGVKIGKALGLEVTVISTSERKREKAMAMGVDHFVVSSDKAQMEAAGKSLKFIIDTVSAEHQAKDFLPLLETAGTLCIVGIPANAMELSAPAMLMRRLSFTGSLIGGIADTQEVIDLCAKHQCAPEVEVLPLADVNKALADLADNNLPAGKFRFVLDVGNHCA